MLSHSPDDVRREADRAPANAGIDDAARCNSAVHQRTELCRRLRPRRRSPSRTVTRLRDSSASSVAAMRTTPVGASGAKSSTRSWPTTRAPHPGHVSGRRHAAQRVRWRIRRATRQAGPHHRATRAPPATPAGSSRASPSPGAKRPSISVAPRYSAIARARQRHVQQALGLLVLLRLVVAIGLVQVLAHGHRRARPRPPLFAGERRRDDPNGVAAAAAALPEIDDEDDRELESLGGVDRHQVHGVGRVDDGVGFVAAGHQLREVVDEPAERGVAAVLDAADQAAHLLQVLARLRQPGPGDLHRIGRLGEHAVDQLGRRQLIGQREPRPPMLSRASDEPLEVVCCEQPSARAGRFADSSASARSGASSFSASSESRDDARSQERRGPQGSTPGPPGRPTSASTSFTSSASKKPSPL